MFISYQLQGEFSTTEKQQEKGCGKQHLQWQ
jgi:hypothetical protein